MKITLKDKEGIEFCDCEYIAEETLARIDWKVPYITVENVQQLGHLTFELFAQYKVTRLLNNGTSVENSWDDANEWLATNWMPKAIEAGLLKFANVLSENLYSLLSGEFMQDNAQKLENVFELQIFHDVEKARDWVLS